MLSLMTSAEYGAPFTVSGTTFARAYGVNIARAATLGMNGRNQADDGQGDHELTHGQCS